MYCVGTYNYICKYCIRYIRHGNTIMFSLKKKKRIVRLFTQIVYSSNEIYIKHFKFWIVLLSELITLSEKYITLKK